MSIRRNYHTILSSSYCRRMFSITMDHFRFRRNNNKPVWMRVLYTYTHRRYRLHTFQHMSYTLNIIITIHRSSDVYDGRTCTRSVRRARRRPLIFIAINWKCAYTGRAVCVRCDGSDGEALCASIRTSCFRIIFRRTRLSWKIIAKNIRYRWSTAASACARRKRYKINIQIRSLTRFRLYAAWCETRQFVSFRTRTVHTYVHLVFNCTS